MAEEEVAISSSPLRYDHKRKYEDSETPSEQNPLPREVANGRESNDVVENRSSDPMDEKRPRTEEETEGPEITSEVVKLLSPSVVDVEQPPTNTVQTSIAIVARTVDSGLEEQYQDTSVTPFERHNNSRKIEIPNSKPLREKRSRRSQRLNNVGVLIGKAGDTIRYLQYNSGAKIQIMRDANADPNSTNRPVELIGTLESISKAEQLIKDVIAEADAGGSPALVARGFSTIQTGAEQLLIQVPNEKVGLIIGKGGDTIKNLQTKSGARIQLVPHQLSEGDTSKERTVRVSGTSKQIEIVSEMIMDVMNQTSKSIPPSGSYIQPGYRPRGPVSSQWGSRGHAPTQTTNYGYPQRGDGPPQPSQYPPQGAQYPTKIFNAPNSALQQAPVNTYGSGWDQRSSGPAQGSPQTSGYYGQVVGSMSTQSPSTGYSQSMPPPQSYGQGYSDQKYEMQGQGHPSYPVQIGSSQPNTYSQQGGMQSGCVLQPYAKSGYNVPSGPSQPYGPPKTAQTQVGDNLNAQPGPVSSSHQFGTGGQVPQSYPYTGAPSQSYPYDSNPAASDGYGQPPSSVSGAGPSSYGSQGAPIAMGYSQQPVIMGANYPHQGGSTAGGYAQPGPQPGAGYPQQGAQYSPYGQYPVPQPGYGEQAVPNTTTNYGYQGSSDGGYGAPASYNIQGAHSGYPQPILNQPNFDQLRPQPVYGPTPGSAPPTGYNKNLSPQTTYNQYGLTPTYGPQ